MEDKVIKCTQCGANLPKDINICEYCGAKYKKEDVAKSNIEEILGEGDIISKIGKIGGLFEDAWDDLFD